MRPCFETLERRALLDGSDVPDLGLPPEEAPAQVVLPPSGAADTFVTDIPPNIVDSPDGTQGWPDGYTVVQSRPAFD